MKFLVYSPKHLQWKIDFHFLTFRKKSVVALKRNKKVIQCSGRKKINLKLALWIMRPLCNEFRFKYLFQTFINPWGSPFNFTPHLPVSASQFTLHMFHAFHTFTLLANIIDQKQRLTSPLPNGRKVQRVIIWQTAHSDLSLGC